jgi:hypothetical protein
MKHVLFFLVLLLAGSTIYAYAPAEEARIYDRGILLPLNRFLLIKRGDYLGAVIFVSYEKNDQGYFVHYRAYKHTLKGWQEEKSGDIALRSLTFGQRVLGKLGIHTPPLSRIKPLELKDFTLFANPSLDSEHAVVYYGPDVDHLDPNIKLAPTPWRTIEEVNLKEPRLKWYESGSREQDIRIDELLK